MNVIVSSMHLDPDQIERYLAKQLSPSERIAVSDHLAKCAKCRAEIVRDERFQAWTQTAITDLTGLQSTPTRKRFGSERSRAMERLARDMRVQPGSPAPDPVTKVPWVRRLTEAFLATFRLPVERPWAFAAVAAAAVMMISFVQFWRDSSTSSGESPLLAIEDTNRPIQLGKDGLIARVDKSKSTALAETNGELRRLLAQQSLEVPSSVRTLKEEASPAGVGNSEASFRPISPVLTGVDTTTPMFTWSACPGATSYVVDVAVDDGSSRVVFSRVLATPDNKSDTVRLQLPASNALARGQKYEWSVTAHVGDQEVHSSRYAEDRARFVILTQEQSAALSTLRSQTAGSKLLDGLLDMRAGLLDDGLTQFEELLRAPNQSTEAKEFLSRTIKEVRSMKE
ncbi:MAG: zf-HC2 domain-containing protein [Verrucomicrobia bacterium]|nr:zf-HC2 domain-containing protein [Verrucomicrobiota bacterium]